MQKYKSHKVVEAAKIIGFEVNVSDEGATLTFADQAGTHASNAWLDKNAPGWGTHAAEVDLVGGYFVQYADGYTSWSPAEAFEQGYVEIKEGDAAGLPVAGYKPTQPQWAIDAVNAFKALEERTLRAAEALDGQAVDHRLLAIGKTQLQGAFMFLARAVFQPGRVALPED